jgi:hypothetical protein
MALDYTLLDLFRLMSRAYASLVDSVCSTHTFG